MGHTMAIHSENQDVILQFGLKKPAFRICVNTPTTHGSIGLTTGLDPAMTLGCGGWGGNITSDNISPRHLLNIKRLRYEVRPAAHPQRWQPTSVRALATPEGTCGAGAAGISAQALSTRIDAFLSSRGYRATTEAPGPAGRNRLNPARSRGPDHRRVRVRRGRTGGVDRWQKVSRWGENHHHPICERPRRID
jgi:hypothetical protein